MNQRAHLRPLRDAAEALACAQFMAASEPWLTLRASREELVHRLTAPAREVYVGTIQEELAGVLILNLEGVLNGYIQTIAVHPKWQCRGIGTQLIQFAEERIFAQSPNVFLCVSSFNLHAQRLYERLGYERVGELRDFVVAGHDEYLMRKTRGPWRVFQPDGSE